MPGKREVDYEVGFSCLFCFFCVCVFFCFALLFGIICQPLSPMAPLKFATSLDNFIFINISTVNVKQLIIRQFINWAISVFKKKNCKTWTLKEKDPSFCSLHTERILIERLPPPMHVYCPCLATMVFHFASTHFVSLMECSLPGHGVLMSYKTKWLTKHLHYSKQIMMSYWISFKKSFIMLATRIT